MGQQEIGSLYAKIGAEMSGFENAMKDVKASINDAAGKVNSSGEKMQNGLGGVTAKAGGLKGALNDVFKVAAGFGVFTLASQAVGGLTSQFTDMITSAGEAEEIQAQLAAVIKSTGGVAGMTADAVNDLAGELQNVTKFEDDATIAGANLLLTFTNIGKDVFPEATRTMLDMSQALGQDLKSSAIQLGKALNDPIEGMTALKRVGVSFTQEQKEQIMVLQESGDLMGAQKVILAELAREFSGAAEAAGGTFAGKLAILTNKFDDFKEKIGTAVIPVLEQVLDKIMPIFDGLEGGIDKVIPKVVSALSDFAASVGKWVATEGVKQFAIFGKQLADGLATGIFDEMKSQGSNLNLAMWGWMYGGDVKAKNELEKTRQAVKDSLTDLRGTVKSEIGTQLPSIFTRTFDAIKTTTTTGMATINENFKTATELMAANAATGAEKTKSALGGAVNEIAKLSWMAAATAAGIQFGPITENPLQKLLDDAGKYGFEVFNLDEMSTKVDAQLKTTTERAKATWKGMWDGFRIEDGKYTDSLGITWDVIEGLFNKGTAEVAGAGGATGGGAAAGNLEKAIGTATETWLKDVEMMSLSIQELPEDSWKAFDTIKTESTRETRSMWDAIKVHTGIGILETVGKWTGFWTSLKSETDIGVAQVIASLNPLFIALQSLTFARNSATAPVTGASVTTGGVVDLTGSNVMAGPRATTTAKQEAVLQVDGRTFARLIGPYLDNRVRITA